MIFTNYDEQIAYLQENPEKLLLHFINPNTYGPLFKFMETSPTRNSGCPILIKGNEKFYAYVKGEIHKEFTQKVRSSAIPDKVDIFDFGVITLADLNLIRDLQMEYDALKNA